MAIDPRISMGVQQASVLPAINTFMQVREQQRQMALDPLRMQQQQQQIGLQDQALQRGQLDLNNLKDQQDVLSVANFSKQNRSLFDAQDLPSVTRAIVERKTQLQKQGRDTTQTDEMIQILNNQGLEGLNQKLLATEGIADRLTQQQRPVQFGAQQTFKDEQGNLFFGTQKRDPTTGKVETAFSAVSGSPTLQPQGQLNLVSGLGQTAQEKAETKVETTQEIENIKANAEGKSSAIKAGVNQAVKAFEKMPLVQTAINNYQEAINALDAGANTGTIDRMLPSLNRASKELDNVIKRLGLDVVGNTTFGALSESELDFALQAAIPDNLEPEELKQWLTAKKSAQEKLLSGLNEMSNYLGGGEKTIADWNRFQAIKSLSGQAQQPELTTNPTSQMDTAIEPMVIGGFTVEVVED